MTHAYEIRRVNGHEWHDRIDPLYRRHYAEMKARLDGDGMPIGDYAPRLDQYFPAMDRGDLLTFIVLEKETIVGYSNIWLTNDMHNGELIAQEDTIYILPEHRNGIGRKLAKVIIDLLQKIGVRRFTITAVTDTRMVPVWQRMGFKPLAQMMTYTFEVENVRT